MPALAVRRVHTRKQVGQQRLDEDCLSVDLRMSLCVLAGGAPRMSEKAHAGAQVDLVARERTAPRTPGLSHFLGHARGHAGGGNAARLQATREGAGAAGDRAAISAPDHECNSLSISAPAASPPPAGLLRRKADASEGRLAVSALRSRRLLAQQRALEGDGSDETVLRCYPG
jgi:hypothetical protein